METTTYDLNKYEMHTIFPPFGDSPAVIIGLCKTCGVIVFNAEQHDAWHNRAIACTCPGEFPMTPGNQHEENCPMKQVRSIRITVD